MPAVAMKAAAEGRPPPTDGEPGLTRWSMPRTAMRAKPLLGCLTSRNEMISIADGFKLPDAMSLGPDDIDQLFLALEEQLRADKQTYELVVIGGSALEALGFIRRGTKDVDVLALKGPSALESADPLPEALTGASARVANDFNLSPDWLNAGPADLLRLGLPEGFWERVISRRYGPSLTVHFAGRLDHVHFKLYAMVDHGGGRHEADLRALHPTTPELLLAGAWTQTHDPSPAFRELLEQALRALGVDDDCPRP